MGLLAEYLPVLSNSLLSIVLSKGRSFTKFSCFLSTNLLNFFLKQGFISSLYWSLSSLQTREMDLRWTILLLRAVVLSVQLIFRVISGVVLGLNELMVPQSSRFLDSGDPNATFFRGLFVPTDVQVCLSGLVASFSMVLSITILFLFTKYFINANQITLPYLFVCFPFIKKGTAKINFIMTNRQKNNFNERIKRIGGGQQVKLLKDRNISKKMHFTSMGELPKEVQEKTEPGKSEEMFDFMKKELDTLMVKLEEAEKERLKIAGEMATLTNKLVQKDKETQQLTRELEHCQNSVRQYKQKLEDAESQLENMRLRQKMETISKEITQQITLEKQPAASVKHLKHQKGKFSKAALPPAFGSQKKIEFHTANLIKEEEVGGVHSLLRNPFSGYLIDQWQRTHNQRNNKELQIATLQGKIASLKKELLKQSKEIEQIKAEKPTRQELVVANDRIRQLERKERTLMIKLKESEKRKDVSMIKQKGYLTQQDRFYGGSIITDINEMIQKSGKNLEIQQNVLQLVVNIATKINSQAQTQDNKEKGEPINPLLEVVNELQEKLKQRQQQFSSECLDLKHQYEHQLHQCISQLQSQKIKIQEYSQILESFYAKEQRQCSSIGIECYLSKEQQFQNRSHILEKVKELIQVNEQCRSTIYKLRTENQELCKQLDFFNKQTNLEERSVQVEIQHFFREEEQDVQCPGCKSLKQQAYSEKQEVKRLTKIIQTITGESQHFKHCYQQILTSYKQLENDSQREINKLRAQYLQKEKNLIVAESDLQQITFQMQRYKSQFIEIQQRLREESLILRESFDC